MSERIEVPVTFAPPAVKVAGSGAMRLSIATDTQRGGAQLAARLHRPGVARDALLAIGDVLGSDLRRKATDRADYLQYLISRGKGVSKAVWDAQKEYLALQYSAAAKHEEPLDPVLTVTADALRFEVLSRDESTYAQLVLRRPGGARRRGSTPVTRARVRHDVRRARRRGVRRDRARFAAIARPTLDLRTGERSERDADRAAALAARVRPDAGGVAARGRTVRAVADRPLQRAAHTAHAQGEDRAARLALRARARRAAAARARAVGPRRPWQRRCVSRAARRASSGRGAAIG